MEIKNLVKRALKSQPTPKPQSGMVYLETLRKRDKFSLHDRTGEVIHTTPESVYIEIDSHTLEGEFVPKAKTHWAGQTQVRRIK